MTREQAKAIIEELTVKKKLNSVEKAKLKEALKVIANKWSTPG